MTYENITAEVRGKVGLITLNRPKQLNALNDYAIPVWGASGGGINQQCWGLPSNNVYDVRHDSCVFVRAVNGQVGRPADVTDGLSTTMMFGEKFVDVSRLLGWNHQLGHDALHAGDSEKRRPLSGISHQPCLVADVWRAAPWRNQCGDRRWLCALRELERPGCRFSVNRSQE